MTPHRIDQRRAPRRLRVLVFAAATLALAASTHPAAAAQSRAFVVTTDYSTGGVSAIDLTTRAVTSDVASAFKDLRVRWYDGRLYVINRFGADNIQVIDPAQNYATVQQFSVGNGANPSDIVVFSPTRAYVTLYQRPEILIVNPTTGVPGGSIDLSAFADADGRPEPDRMARFGRWVLVSVQRLDENNFFSPTDSSQVVVIDSETNAVVDLDPVAPGPQGILLPRTNPVTPFAWDPIGRKFYLGCVATYGATDGAVVRIDPESFTVDGIAITEAALGGDVSDVEWHTATHAYALISDASFNASLVSWNPSNGTLIAPLFSPGGFGLADCAINDRGELYLCDNSFGVPGVRIYSTATDLPIAGPLDTGLPPYELAFDAMRNDVVADVPAQAPAFALTAGPNPARERIEFRIHAIPGNALKLDIFDLVGRRVRSLADGRATGVATVSWNLQASDGTRVAPGLYLARARLDGREVVRRITVVR